MKYIPLAFATLLLGASLACAAPVLSTQEGGKVPTNIKSSSVEYNADNQTVVFSGKVHITRPDFQLWSDKLTVYLKKTNAEPKSGSTAGMEAGEIDRIVAENNVIIKSGPDKEARSQKATYTADKDEFKLEGSPWLRDKENTIKGNIIYHYLTENKSRVSGSADVNFFAPDKTGTK